MNNLNIPISGRPPFLASHFGNDISPLCTAFLPASRCDSSTSSSLPKPLLYASKIPLSSNVSLIAASLYASPSTCLFGSSTSGTLPSWNSDTFPPGNTWAEGKELEVRTRWRSRTWFVGEITRTLVVVSQGASNVQLLLVPRAWSRNRRRLLAAFLLAHTPFLCSIYPSDLIAGCVLKRVGLGSPISVVEARTT